MTAAAVTHIKLRCVGSFSRIGLTSGVGCMNCSCSHARSRGYGGWGSVDRRLGYTIACIDWHVKVVFVIYSHVVAHTVVRHYKCRSLRTLSMRCKYLIQSNQQSHSCHVQDEVPCSVFRRLSRSSDKTVSELPSIAAVPHPRL